MKKWLRRIRATLGMGLTWAAAWFGVGALIGLVGGVGAVALAISWAQIGFVGGVIFSTLLGILEGRRRFDEMSLPVFAGIGGTVGGLIAFGLTLTAVGPVTLTLVGLFNTGVVFLLSAGSAAGSLALARRADDRELLEHGADVSDIGLTEEEKRELLAG